MAQDKEIKRLSDLIEKLVQKEVAPVAPVAPVLPIAPLASVNPLDHDLLTKLDAKVDQIQADVTILKAQGNSYVTQADHRIVCDKQEDHETRLRAVEKGLMYVFASATGAGAVIGIIIEYFLRK
jgi:enoyl-CoA hydratase/carnithine racemase